MPMGSFISSTGLSFLQTGSAEHIRHWPLSCSPLSELYARPSRSDYHESVDHARCPPCVAGPFRLHLPRTSATVRVGLWTPGSGGRFERQCPSTMSPSAGAPVRVLALAPLRGSGRMVGVSRPPLAIARKRPRLRGHRARLGLRRRSVIGDILMTSPAPCSRLADTV
jgi:hypothetical protein